MRVTNAVGRVQTVFVSERANGKIVLAQQSSAGTARNVYKDRAGALRALRAIQAQKH